MSGYIEACLLIIDAIVDIYNSLRSDVLEV